LKQVELGSIEPRVTLYNLAARRLRSFSEVECELAGDGYDTFFGWGKKQGTEVRMQFVARINQEHGGE
jgi:hypothetical protein